MSRLSASELTLWRGPHCLFEALSFDVAPGDAVLVRGANGSGKTTLLRVLCGLTQPEEGRVTWDGTPVEKNRAAYGRALAYFGHLTGLKADLSVRENLAFATRLAGHGADGIDTLLHALGLADAAGLEVRYLSAGQQRRTALARVLLSRADLWILDEPFTNLDAAGRVFIEQRIAAHLDVGGMAIIAAHDTTEIRPNATIRLGATT